MVTVTEIPADLLSAVDVSFDIGRFHLTSGQAYTRHLRASTPTDERWLVEMTLQFKDREDLDRYSAIFDAGDGLGGYYSAFDAVHGYPRGTATGLLQTSEARFSDGSTFSDGTTFESGIAYGTIGAAAARGASSVTLSGLLASQTVGFAQGDHFAIPQGSENYGFLHRVVAAAATDASGNATVTIRPRLREAVVVGQRVNFLRPRGVFRLAEATSATFNRGPGGMGQPSLSLVEAPEALTCVL